MAKAPPESILQTRLRELMLEQQMSHAQLSRRAGPGQTAVNDIMSGRNRSPSNRAVEKLAAALGTGVEQLITRREARRAAPAPGATDAIPLVGIAEAGAWRAAPALVTDIEEIVN